MNLERRVAALEKKVQELEQLLHHTLERDNAAKAGRPDWPPPPSAEHAAQPTSGPQLPSLPDQQLNAPQHSSQPEQPLTGSQLPPSPDRQLPAQKEPAPQAPPTDWEHLIARVWLPRIFILVFLLGVLWGFTAAVNAGIITEPIRCWLGAAAAFLMYWQGEVQIRRNRAALGQVLLGGASGVLILTLFAAHMLFELIPASIAFLLYVISLAISVYTAIRHRSQALMIITLLAGYLVPFLIETEQPNMWTFAGYEGLFSMAMLLLSLRYSFRGAYFTAFGVLHLPLLIATIAGHEDSDRPALLAVVIVQHLLLFAVSLLRSQDSRIGQRIALFLSFGLLAAWSYGLYGASGVDRLFYESMLALWSILYIGTSIWLYRNKRNMSTHLAIATFGVFLWLIYVLRADQAGAALLVEGSLALVLGTRFRSRLQQVSGALTYFIGMLIVFDHGIDRILSSETFAWLLLVVTIGGLYAFYRKQAKADLVHPQFPMVLLWLEFVLLLVYVSQLTNVMTKGLDSDYQHLILSGVWAVYAVLLIIAGQFVRKAKANWVGILFLFITLLKIIFIDLPDVSTAVRAILFIGLGAIGVGISRLFYKRKEPNE
ncbi:DUF2339 domain-containing protein [Bacillus sp. 3255]|uniref:DUF2339 domain-containing protein n=1 Tax=Bacillus sp. 3255 TaxID=2817904 RepID=UPI00285DD4C6|nr:DUF2339 domain-containing protein [Bacillus sp. 3255]MDR6879120.1 putative membrane protein [Bacillus sp. 3255]